MIKLFVIFSRMFKVLNKYHFLINFIAMEVMEMNEYRYLIIIIYDRIKINMKFIMNEKLM